MKRLIYGHVSSLIGSEWVPLYADQGGDGDGCGPDLQNAGAIVNPEGMKDALGVCGQSAGMAEQREARLLARHLVHLNAWQPRLAAIRRHPQAHIPALTV